MGYGGDLALFLDCEEIVWDGQYAQGREGAQEGAVQFTLFCPPSSLELPRGVKEETGR